MRERAREKGPYNRTSSGGGVHPRPENSPKQAGYRKKMTYPLSCCLPISWWCLSLAKDILQGALVIVCLGVSVLQPRIGQGTAGNGSDSRGGGVVCKKPAWVLRFSKISFSTIGLFFIPNGELSIKK